MKKLTYSVLMIMTMSLFIGCDDDEPESATHGSLFVEDQEYPLSTALTEFIGEEDGLYHWRLILASGGLTFNESTGWYTGEGDYISFDLYAYENDSDNLPAEYYTAPPGTAGHAIDTESVALGYQASNEESDELYETFDTQFLTAVKNEDGTYTLNFEAVVEFDQIYGNYSGIVEMVDFSK